MYINLVKISCFLETLSNVFFSYLTVSVNSRYGNSSAGELSSGTGCCSPDKSWWLSSEGFSEHGESTSKLANRPLAGSLRASPGVRWRTKLLTTKAFPPGLASALLGSYQRERGRR